MAELKLKQPKARELLGGDLLAQSLAHLGAKVAFGVHGGHLDSFLVGCELVGIRLVDTRHETVSVQAAEGYAKISGGVGLCFVTANSGFCNGIPGLATSFADRSPVFCVTSSAPLRDAESNCLQGFHDQVVLSKPITKFAHRVTTVEEIPRIVSFAWRTAQSGIPGPVVVDFPIDVLFTPPRIGAISWGALNCDPASEPGPNPAAIDQLVSIWRAAARPVIISGTGAARTTSPASKNSPLLQLAEATNTPVFYSTKYSPAVPHSHPLRGGPAAVLAVLPFINQPQPDVVILLGARTGWLLGGRAGVIIPNSNRTLVQVDIDGGEIGRLLPVDLGIVSDANLFIAATLAKLKATGSEPFPTHDDWVKTAGSLKSLPAPYESQPTIMPDGHLHPWHAVKTLYAGLPEGSVIIIDGGEAGVWASSAILESARASHTLVSTGYLGYLGNGWGYSLGAAIACPDRLVVNIQGDGSAGFHIAELDTYARHGCNVLTVVVNNYFWGMSAAGQDLLYGADEPARPVVALSPVCRFDIVAQGFGCRGVKVQDSLQELETAVRELTQTTEAGSGSQQRTTPALIDLIVSRNPFTEMTKAAVGKPQSAEEAKSLIVIPYYDNVPRPYYTSNGV